MSQPASLTEGSILRPLVRLALPFAVGSTLNLVTLVVDRFWVGRVGTIAMAALGNAHPALMTILTVFLGMSVGTLSGVARHVGAGDARAAARYYGQGTLIALTMGLLAAGLAFWLPPLVFEFMGSDPAVRPDAEAYLRISMWGLMLQGPVMIVAFSLQGAGEAAASLRLSTVAPIANVVLDPIFIFTLELGVAGAAWATLAAHGLALVAGGWMLARGNTRLQPTFDVFLPALGTARRIFEIGVPGSLEHVVRNVAAFLLVKLMNPFGPHVVSAYTASMVLTMALIFPGLALGQATASLVGQNLGAGEPRRAWRTAWLSTALYTGAMVGATALTWVVAGPLVAVFDPNPAVVAEGTRLLRVFSLCFPFIGVALILSKAFGGAGTTMPAMLAAAVAHLLVQIPAVWWLSQIYGTTGAYAGMALAFTVHGVLSAVLYIRRFRPAG